MGVGFRLKELLRMKGMTIKQLSEKTGISLNTLYSITKRDSERVDSILLYRIAAALDCAVVDLLEDTDWGVVDTDVLTDIIFDDALIDKVTNGMKHMNHQGREKVLERVNELLEVPKYKIGPGDIHYANVRPLDSDEEDKASKKKAPGEPGAEK